MTNNNFFISLYGDYWKNHQRRFGDDNDDEQDNVRTEFRYKYVTLPKQEEEKKENSITGKCFIRDVNEFMEGYKYFKDTIIKSCKGFILVYNINDHENSFNNIKRWLHDIKRVKCASILQYWQNYYNNQIINQITNVLIVADIGEAQQQQNHQSNFNIIKEYANSISIPFIEVTNTKSSNNTIYQTIVSNIIESSNNNGNVNQIQPCTIQ